MTRWLLLSCLLPSLILAADYDYLSEDVDYSDLRLSVGVPSRHMQGSYNPAAGGTRDSSIDWTRSSRISLTWVPWPSRATPSGDGFMAIELSSLRYQLAEDDLREKIDQRLIMADVLLGLAWVPARAWTIESAWQIGIGQSWQPGSTASFGAYEIGGRLGAMCAVGSSIHLGATVSVTYMEWSNRAQLDGQDYNLSFSGFGVTPALVAGIRF